MPDARTNVVQETIEPTQRGSRFRYRKLDTILIGLLTLSLIAHVLTFAVLMGVRTTLHTQLDRLADSVQQAKSTTVRYSVPIDQSVPINIRVPLQRSFNIPIRTDVRVNQTIRIPIDTGFGVANVPVPIDATIPISVTIPIEIQQDVPISTTVPIRFSVPLQIDLGSSEFATYLDQLARALRELREQF